MFHIKKYRGNIAAAIIIFTLALFFLCICAIDAGYVILTRYKVQKVTETTALYMASYIKSKPAEERNPASLNNIKEKIQNLYSNKDLSGYTGFKITDIELKNADINPKIKITTETYTPALFLRFFGLGIIKIHQTSYATSEENKIPLQESDTKSYTFKSNDIITDKTGDDIKINYDSDYLIFAGLEDYNGKIRWADIGSKTDSKKTKVTITNGASGYEAYCINKGETAFDFSKESDEIIGLARYIKIYKTECNKETEEIKTDTPAPDTSSPDDSEKSEDITPEPDDTKEKSPTGDDTEDPEETTTELNEPVVTILNSVRLIKRSEF